MDKNAIKSWEDMAAASDRYRRRLAAAAAAPGTKILPYRRGHGAALVAALAAQFAGARTTLIVAPPAARHSYAMQLEQAGYNVVLIPAEKDAMGDACRDACGYAGQALRVYMCIPRQTAGAGHWLDAWRGGKPFGLVVLEAQDHKNLRSERGIGLKALADRAGMAVLMVSDEIDPSNVETLRRNWDAALVHIDPARDDG